MHYVQTVLPGLFFSISLGSFVAVDLEERISDVAVNFASAGGTTIKASIKNKGAEVFNSSSLAPCSIPPLWTRPLSSRVEEP